MNCDYLTYVSGALTKCGKPATHQAAKPSSDRTHRCYCEEHNKVVTKPGGISTRAFTAKERLEHLNSRLHVPMINAPTTGN